MNPNFFQFEADFVENLRCIPMQVRFKLDTCGIKLKLADWENCNFEEREQLVTKPCYTPKEIANYKQFLQDLVREKTNTYPQEIPVDNNPPWLNEEEIPHQVQEKLRELNLNLSINQWAKLSPLQRFALLKLSRPSHENKNFYPAFVEFGLS